MVTKWNKAFMRSAAEFGRLSHATRAKVGAVIVKDNTIISIGYNGMPSGWDNGCEYQTLNSRGQNATRTRPEVLHAESNAITKVARSTQSCDGAEIYVTMAPCIECAKLIHQSGINKVYYANDHLRSNDGIKFLEKCEIEVINVPI